MTLRTMKRKIWTDIERRIIPVKTSETLSERMHLTSLRNASPRHGRNKLRGL